MGATAGEASEAALLVAADDARLRARTIARTGIAVGVALIIGSTLLWPRGIYGIGANDLWQNILLIASGTAALLLGVFVVAWSVRRIRRLQNNYSSAGKPDAGYVFQPDIGVPQIGQGHGGPMDASAALFANPNKVNNGRR